MGPSRLFQKNRSQHSLLNAQEANARAYAASPIDSPQQSPGFPPPSSAPPPLYDDDDDNDDPPEGYDLPYRSEEARYYNQSPPVYHHGPTRSQSQRSPVSINTNQPTIQLVRPPQGFASTPASAIEPDEPDRYYYERAPDPPPHKEKRSKRSFFGLGSSKEPTSQPPPNKLGRSRSVRTKEQYPEAVVQTSRGHRHQLSHNNWTNTHVSPTTDDEEDEDGGTGLHPFHSYSSAGASEKDPLRSPGFPPPLSQHEYTHGKNQTISNHNQGIRQPDKQGYHSWDRVAQQSAVHPDSSQVQTPTSYHPSPASATSASAQQFHHKSPSDAFREHLHDDSRPASRQSLEPSVSSSHPYGHHARGSSSQASSASYMQGSMGPSSNQPSAPRRGSSEAAGEPQRGQSREGNYQPYSQNISGSVIPSNAPPPYIAQLAPQGQNYRGGSQPSPMTQPGNLAEQDRRSPPPPSRSRDDLSSLEFNQLLARHDELQDKYRKVKKYYFDKDAQVSQLQNTLAHQRLSMTRTSLDDNEYANRFSRLDGAINNLAFNIRRDWRAVPPWLAPHVNRDAATQPTKEMTAVGRAAISRWLVDELLERYFHPALEPGFSSQLKIIEKNLRRFAPITNTDDEKDNLLSKISNWRLSTLDGLQEVLASPQAGEYRAQLTSSLIDKLVASLSMLLKEPVPPGLEGGVSMIVELAIGIAANLPQESRDVFINYINPGQPINENFMKIETTLPPLINPGDGPSDLGDSTSLLTTNSQQNEETVSIDSRDTGASNGTPNNGADDNTTNNSAGQQPQSQQQSQQQQPQQQQQQQQQSQQAQQTAKMQQDQQVAKKKGGMFGNFMGGGSSSSSASNAGAANIKKPSMSSAPIGVLAAKAQQEAQQQQQQQQGQGQGQGAAGGGTGAGADSGKKEELQRVRFSTFFAVEVRGRNVLIKAPVYVRD